MNYYKYMDKLLISNYSYDFPIYENYIDYKGIIYFLNKLPLPSKLKSSPSSYGDLIIEKESISNVLENYDKCPHPFLLDNLNKGNISMINTLYPNWERALEEVDIKKWRINLVGLGDVGGTLLTGLRLLGGDIIERIGIYDLDENKSKRWFYEGNQIASPNILNLPPINILDKKDIFNCDMFIFCVTAEIPLISGEVQDVRMAQLQKNSNIIDIYSKLGRKENFQGIFSVVSDPVDLLCYSAFKGFNQNNEGEFDYLGLPPERIKGYGLGVMNGRAAFYGGEEYINEGRVFGPHGKGLIVINSLEHYHKEKSDYLTLKTTNSNLEVRSFGYKPYVAPALSSGAFAILDTLRGNFNYSNVFIDNCFFGIKNRIRNSGVEIEKIKYNKEIFDKIKETKGYLEGFSKRS